MPKLSDNPWLLIAGVGASIAWAGFVVWWLCRHIDDHQDGDDGRE